MSLENMIKIQEMRVWDLKNAIEYGTKAKHCAKSAGYLSEGLEYELGRIQVRLNSEASILKNMQKQLDKSLAK